MPKSTYSKSARKLISTHVRKHRQDGMPEGQAIAAALSEARRAGKKVPARKSRARKTPSAKRATRTATKTRRATTTRTHAKR